MTATVPHIRVDGTLSVTDEKPGEAGENSLMVAQNERVGGGNCGPYAANAAVPYSRNILHLSLLHNRHSCARSL